MVVDTASTSETSVNYQTTRRSIPDDVWLRRMLFVYHSFYELFVPYVRYKY
jgi:hypothetical protein